MNSYYGTEGWILATTPRSEADRVLSIYTKDFGRIEVHAKSVRLLKSKLKGHLNLFDFVRIIVTPGKGYWKLLDAEVMPKAHSHYDLTGELALFLLRVLGGGEASEELWETLNLEVGMGSKEELLALKIKILSYLGMLPEDKDLTSFFSKEAIKFIQSESDECRDVKAVELGIEKILAQNHMV